MNLSRFFASIRRLTLRIARLVYDPVRPHLPEKLTVANGVTIRHRPFFDLTDTDPEYEMSLVSQMRSELRSGDTVAIVGGGKGVSTVHASRIVGETGEVYTYEASTDQIDYIEETLSMNCLGAPATLTHATVGAVSDWSAERFGGGDEAQSVQPSDLPNPDAVVLDCEGAERQIIPELPPSVRTVVVETHGWLDSGREVVEELLEEQGLTVVGCATEDDGMGIHVLSARRNAE